MEKQDASSEFPLVLVEMVPVQPPEPDSITVDEEAGAWRFAYIPPEHWPVVGKATQAIHKAMRQLVEDIIEIGKQLTAVKSILKHGTFRQWIEEEFNFSQRTAQRWMAVYEQFDTRDSIFRQVQPTALYMLAREKTPEAALAEVAERVRAGERLTVQDVLAIIAKHQHADTCEESQETTAQELAKDLRTARKSLSNQVMTKCEWVLGEDAAQQFDYARRILDDLFEQVKLRQSKTWTVREERAQSDSPITIEAANKLLDSFFTEA